MKWSGRRAGGKRLRAHVAIGAAGAADEEAAAAEAEAEAGEDAGEEAAEAEAEAGDMGELLCPLNLCLLV